MEVVGLIVAGVSAFMFGLSVLINRSTLHSVRYFFLTTVGASFWALGIAAFLTIKDSGTLLPFVQLYYIAAALIAVSMFSTAATIITESRGGRGVGIAWVSFVVLSLLLVFVPKFMIEGIIIGDYNTVRLVPIGYAIYSTYFLILFALTIGVLILRIRSEKRITFSTQLRWLLYSYGIPGVFGAIFNLILPALGNYELIWIGPLSALIFIPFAYVAIARHGLFDLKSATVRTIGYTLTLAAMASIYVLLSYSVSILFFGGKIVDGVGLSPANAVIALLLALIFQPLKRFFDKLTNRIFFHDLYSKEEFFREFGRILSYDTDLRLLLNRASKYIAINLKSESVFFAIPDRGSFGINKSKILPVDIEMLSKYYRDNHEFPSVLSVDMVQSDKIRQILGMYRIYMILPLILQEQIIGYLFIGEHKSRGYTTRDIKTIESIANELAISVQNSLSVEEIRELNESLKNSINTATKELRASNNQLQKLDEAKNDFISMASHQLRTPLTSIKGYLDMVIEGDLGKISPTQKAVLSEAFTSSERMVNIINDFLNVSRLQTGKFVIDRSKNDLKEVLREQIGMLRVMAKQHDLKIVENIDETIPIMNVDVDKLQQVIVNFIDNAIYYSKPGTSIRVKLEKQKDQIIFTVKDTGIGVPKSEQSQLFGRFFRASNARQRRPDGTGVGLFLAKKVVLLHGGQIIFESQEGKGSTFGFSLPIKQPKTNS